MNDDKRVSRYGELALAPHTEIKGSSVHIQTDMYIHPYGAKNLRCKCGSTNQFSFNVCLTVRQTQLKEETVTTLEHLVVQVFDDTIVECQTCFYKSTYKEFVERYVQESEEINKLINDITSNL